MIRRLPRVARVLNERTGKLAEMMSGLLASVNGGPLLRPIQRMTRAVRPRSATQWLRARRHARTYLLRLSTCVPEITATAAGHWLRCDCSVPGDGASSRRDAWLGDALPRLDSIFRGGIKCHVFSRWHSENPLARFSLCKFRSARKIFFVNIFKDLFNINF